MDYFLGTLGLMFFIFVVSELLASFGRKTDALNIPNFITYPLTILMYLCMLCSAPIWLYMMWHDKVREKIYHKLFLEERREYDLIQERKERDLKGEIHSLREKNSQLTDELFDESIKSHDEGKRIGLESGYWDGYKQGLKEGLAIADLPMDQQRRLFLENISDLDFLCKRYIKDYFRTEDR